jgi:quercetin dioxygenase-like cupin family protein
MAMLYSLFRAAGIAAVAFVACLGSSAVQAQTAPPAATQGASDIKRTILQRFDVPGSNYETVIALVEIGPNAAIGKHTHFGFDSGVLQSGDIVLNAEGRSEQVAKPGDSWQIPPNTVHWGTVGPNGAKVINTYVIEKGKPLATPVQ